MTDLWNDPTIEQSPEPLPDAQRVDGTIRADEVTTGDLVFCARSSFLQELCTRAGEPWRHVGLAYERDGVTMVVEVSGPRFGERKLTTILDSYRWAAIGRVGARQRAASVEAANWCAHHVGDEQVYAWDDLVLAGFIAVTRRWSLPHERAKLERAVATAIEVLATAQQRREPPFGVHPGYSCSAFLLAAFAEVGHPLHYDLGLPRGFGQRPSIWELIRSGPRPLRSVEGTHMSGRQAASVLRALVAGMFALSDGQPPSDSLKGGGSYRWATPGDLWRSPSITERRYLIG